MFTGMYIIEAHSLNKHCSFTESKCKISICCAENVPEGKCSPAKCKQLLKELHNLVFLLDRAKDFKELEGDLEETLQKYTQRLPHEKGIHLLPPGNSFVEEKGIKYIFFYFLTDLGCSQRFIWQLKW